MLAVVQKKAKLLSNSREVVIPLFSFLFKWTSITNIKLKISSKIDLLTKMETPDALAILNSDQLKKSIIAKMLRKQSTFESLHIRLN